MSIESALVESLPDPLRFSLDTTTAAKNVETAIAGARRRWSAFSVEPEAFAHYVASRLTAEDDAGRFAALELEDLYLAFGCLAGDAAATRAFLHVAEPEIDRARREVGLRSVPSEELRQHVCERLLVPRPNGPARLASYRGHGPLRRWVAMAAARTAVDLRRGAGATPTADPPAASLAEPLLGIETKLLEGKLAHAFRRAFRDVVTAMQPNARALLRLRYVEGLTVTEIAKLKGVHRVTLSRRLTELRAEVETQIRARIVDREGIADGELQEALRQIRSRLDFSLSVLRY